MHPYRRFERFLVCWENNIKTMFDPIFKDNYCVRKADSLEEVRMAQKLRYEVFNVELGEGLESSLEDQRDKDPFDIHCDHLIVEHLPEQTIVGTYRVQTGQRAAEGIGYYSAQEFDLTPYEKYRHKILELGRACVHVDHRKQKVLKLLWRGIARYAFANKSRYLIGCSSLTSQSSGEGWALYHKIKEDYMVSKKFQTMPLPDYQLDPESGEPVEVKCPRLFAAYLGLGARIAGPPAIDRAFKTIDFFTLFDFKKVRKTGALDFIKKND